MRIKADWTDEKHNKFLEMYNEGCTDRMIATELGLKDTHIATHRLKYNLLSKHPNGTNMTTKKMCFDCEYSRGKQCAKITYSNPNLPPREGIPPCTYHLKAIYDKSINRTYYAPVVTECKGFELDHRLLKKRGIKANG